MPQMKKSVPLKMFICLLTVSFLMTACAATPDKREANESTAKTETSAQGSQSSQTSNKLDACALLSKSSAESVLGMGVQSAELIRATEGTANTAAFSECRYQLDARQMITLAARRSPVMDNTPEAIKRVRDTMKEVSGKEAIDVNGLGDTAFWTVGTKQLHVFQGGNVYIYVTMMSYKAGEEQAKEKAIELARRALAALPKQN